MSEIRRFINLIESAGRRMLAEADISPRPTDPNVLERMFDTINTWVTHGPVPDQMMDFVAAHWPRPSNGMKLWRVHILTEQQAEDLKAGKPLSVPVHKYLSWTQYRDAVERLAYARKRGGVPAIIEIDSPAQDICINVGEFHEYCIEIEKHDPDLFDFDTGDLNSYSHESEVIVIHSKPLILTTSNTTIFVPPETPTPEVGQLAYSNDREDGDRILDVIEQDEHGFWLVELHYRGEEYICYTSRGEWEIVDHYG